ncbi:MAG: protein kinase [Pleurocapsa minor GSE-CHR-MK-17-07R]|nr:protein kinase [Pleurocapsa minor GSE-CHR-MK 17-07R]
MMSTEIAPRMIGRRYQIVNELGSGNMGTVFEAIDRLSGQYVAVKQVKVDANKLEYGSRTSGETSLEMTLAQEFKILASLRHPNIISVIDYGFDIMGRVRQPYITMELLHNAESFLEHGERLSHDGRVDLLIQMLQALAYLHRRGILHRDIKPKNVMVVDGQVKVLDFGLSVSAEQAKEGEVAGTPSYMAPELWTGGAATRESDLYAVGVMAYRLFAGQPPFDIGNLKKLFVEVRTRIPDLSLMVTSDAIRAIVGRLLSKVPADRYNDANDLMADLLSASGRPPSAETAATRESFLQAASFVGRGTELSELTELMRESMIGEGSSVLVAGESGVGKSRLLDELRTVGLVQGALVLRGQAVNEVNAPYTLWRGIVRWLVLLAEVSDQEAGVLKALVPDISKLIGRDVKDAPEVTPQVAQTRLLTLLLDLFQRQGAASQQPLLIILEDLHWADSESLLLLSRLCRIVANLKMLVVATYRDDETPEIAEQIRAAHSMRLERLTPEQTAELTRAMLGAAGQNDELLSLLQRETEGNTFFLVEMVRALAEEAGQLAAVGTGRLPLTLLTGGVAGIVRRRLKRVPVFAQGMLNMAAVGGRYLDLPVIHQATGQSADMMNMCLSACADAAVLEVQDGWWRFTHNKLRDVAVADLPHEEFKALNRTIAESVERVYEISSKQNAELLAYYWGCAENAEKEEQYAAIAGEQAFRSGAYHAAAAYLQRALELQPFIESSRRKQAQIKQQLGDANRALGNRDAARGLYDESLATCREIGYRWGVAANLNRLADLQVEAGDMEDAARLLVEGLRTAMDARAQTVALASLVGMASLMARAGRAATAVEFATVAMNHLSTDGQTHYLAERLVASLSSQMPMGEFDQAVERGRKIELKEIVSRILNT